MRIAVFGLGYVGLTSAVCLAKQGHEVCGVDVDKRKVEKIKSGICPIQEPGLAELLTSGVNQKLLTTATDCQGAIAGRDAVMICVGTPSTADGAHDMTHVVNVTREIAAAVEGGRSFTIVYRSTFRPGTTESLIQPLLRSALGEKTMKKISIVYNPEFLRESTAIQDYFCPPKIVIGTSNAEPSTTMERLYAGIPAPVFYTPYREAEFAKLIDNTWHATKVAFANEIGRIAAKLNVNPQATHALFVSDTKLNISATYLRPGGPFGGSCLPKDVKALQHIASDIGADTRLIDSIIHSNESHKYFVFEHCTRRVPPGSPVLMLGLAFKHGSDDLRESPYVDLARRLLDAGFQLKIYDPHVHPDQLIGQNLGYSAIHLPNLRSLLVTRKDAETGDYALVIDTNGTSQSLERRRDVVSLHALSLDDQPRKEPDAAGRGRHAAPRTSRWVGPAWSRDPATAAPVTSATA
jgi:GDP-mannose 6-dehydrogenase